MHRIVIRWTVRLGAADDPDIRRGCFDLCKSRGYGSTPARWRDKEIGGLRSGRAPTGRREYVGPHIEHWQEVVTSVCVRGRNYHGFFCKIENCRGVQRVEVRP